MSSVKEIDVKVVVNGRPVDLKVNIENPVSKLIEEALKKSGNTGQPASNWEMRDSSGTVLDPARKIGSYGVEPGATLFLNLKAGIGG